MTMAKISIFLAVAAGAVWFAVPPICTGVHARAKLARAAIGRNGPIAKALDQYRQDMGYYPDSTLGLAALFKIPSGPVTDQFHGPYMEGTIEELTDSWGNPFVYGAPGKFNKSGFDLYSVGPDGIDQGGREDSDDIKNWSR